MEPGTSLFSGRRLQAQVLAPGRVEIRLDRQGDPVNTLDAEFLAELDSALQQLASDHTLQGVLLSSAKDAFLAGADLQALWQLLQQSPTEQASFCQQMHRVLTRLEELPVPVICAINGYALGGGLETALCADYRVLSGDAKLGFPEVGFGILPGAGGCVRSPRLAGAAVALEWLTAGASHKAGAALDAGMVDEIAEPSHLRQAAIALLDRVIVGELDWRTRRQQRNGRFVMPPEALAAARSAAQRQARHYPAALTIVDLLDRSAALTRDEALAEEVRSFTTLAHTFTARALVGTFIANQQLRRQTRGLSQAARPLRRAAVLGAGIMGGGIAYTSAAKGMPVLLKDIASSQLDLGIGEARKLLARQVETGRLRQAQADAVLASIEPTLEYSGFAGVDIVIEAVVENLRVKQDVLREVESRSRPDCVLASNTSSLLIADIAGALERPENLVGMHFFNPVHMMPLVEVIRGPQSSDAAVSTAVAQVLAMGKQPLVVRDCAGFLVNRLLGAYFAAFLQLLRDGADFEQVDRVMEAWGWPMGPAYLLDVAGIDTLDKAMAILGKAYPEVMAADFRTAIQLLATEKRYGQKTGAGFYRYEADAKGKPRRSPDPVAHALLATIRVDGSRSIADEEILERMMLAMVLEADRCLEQQVIGSAQELDAGMRLGTGFPAHEAGPLWYADRIGTRKLLALSEQYRALGGLFDAGEGLRRRAADNASYY